MKIIMQCIANNMQLNNVLNSDVIRIDDTTEKRDTRLLIIKIN